MPDLAVLVAATELQSALVTRVASEGLECVAFTESEALKALQAITSRKPRLVALDPGFAASSRGKALINRIKADPALKGVAVRVEAAEQAAPAGADPVVSPEPEKQAVADPEPVAEAAPAVAPASLDFTGTRRAPRHNVEGSREILVDGKPGVLVNLSLVGVQLVTAAALKPGQRVRVALSEPPKGALRCGATVIWATFEMTKEGPRYRVGLDFTNPNTAALDAYIGRLKH